MSTKRIAKRTGTSLRLKRAEPLPVNHSAPEPLNLQGRAQLAKVEAVREMINAPDFDVDARLEQAVIELIRREIDG